MGGGDGKVRLNFQISNTVIDYDISTSGISTHKLSANNISYLTVDQSVETFKWDITDVYGRELTCTTDLKSTVNQEILGCTELCSDEFEHDGWCDRQCLTDQCGYDTKDCKKIDLQEKLGCPTSHIANGICDQACNNQVGLFDGGDCLSK